LDHSREELVGFLLHVLGAFSNLLDTVLAPLELLVEILVFLLPVFDLALTEDRVVLPDRLVHLFLAFYDLLDHLLGAHDEILADLLRLALGRRRMFRE
jgi:hypothetical protein